MSGFSHRVGLQLYTCREQAAQNPVEVLEAVAAQGYEAVEFAGFYGLTAAELRSQLDRMGMDCSSFHISMDQLDRPEEIAADARALGTSYAVVGGAGFLDDPQALEDAARRLEKASAALKSDGITLCFHNHGHEFHKNSDGIYLLDALLERLPKGSLMLELDSYWCADAGVNPVQYMLDHREELALLHLKDGDFQGKLSALGEGKASIGEIVSAAAQLGIRDLIVENDAPSPDGISDAGRSIRYLREKLHL